jgi:biopolymer transport protein TolR
MGSNVSYAGNKKSNRHRLSAEINVTPFVDVVLVLLIIFMVTAPMMVSGINVDLPETTVKLLAGNDEPLSIDIDASGKIYLQESQIELSEIAAKLMAVTREKKDTRIFLRGDKKTDYGKIAQVLDLITEAGFLKISLITEAK